MLRAELPRAGIGAEAVALRGNDLVKFSVALARSRSNDALLVCVILRGAAQGSSAARWMDQSWATLPFTATRWCHTTVTTLCGLVFPKA